MEVAEYDGADRASTREFDELLSRARTGDTDARGRMLQMFWLALLHEARRDFPADLQAKGSASDVVQETMLDAHRDLEQFNGRTSEEFFAWLLSLLQHNFSNFARAYRTQAKRQIKREKPLVGAVARSKGIQARSTPESPSDAAIRREAAERLRSSAARLPDEIGELLRLRFRDQLSFAEVGDRLGMTAEAVRKLLTRTLRLLGNELDD
jgi:RNA polymerase sigma-70 factor (ECF subfamily)